MQNAKNLGFGVHLGEFAGHLGGTQTISLRIHHGADCLTKSRWCRLLSFEIDSNAGPGDPGIYVRFVFAEARGDQRNAKAKSLIDATVTAVGDEGIGLGKQPFEWQVTCDTRVGWNGTHYRLGRTTASSYHYKYVRFIRERGQCRHDQLAKVVV